jgi:hydrogenase maturation protein HypF
MTKSALIKVTGTVQGVGFRPYIHNLALKHSLKGIVYNTTGAVIIKTSGPKKKLEAFVLAIKPGKPAASEIKKVSVKYSSKKLPYKNFSIAASEPDSGLKTVPADIALCAQCAAELNDPRDRRHNYPFINCTNCGPRFTIIKDLPYDRKNTVMNEFVMCGECAREYKNPKNRRFHAEPIACPSCGPNVFLRGTEGGLIHGAEAIIAAKNALKKGMIVAVKGLGGFHLAVDATNSGAVEELKFRKKRTNKPFAIMSATVEKIRQYCEVSAYEESLLKSPQAPIVLLRKKKNNIIADNVSPGLAHTGVFLSYTPLHALLFDEDIDALVMTSANLAEEPLQYVNEKAMFALSEIADYFLMHDREIHTRADDSVIKPYAKDKFVFIRRSRGYTPAAIELGKKLPQAIGVGALLKNSPCFIKESSAIPCQHVGDLENEESYAYFTETLSNFTRFYGIKPAAIGCDRHPDYLSTRFAEEYAQAHKIPLVKTQHHYAHFVSVLAENSFRGDAIGVIFDGTGLGDDNNTWGGEFFTGSLSRCRRAGHLKYRRLPGGDAASGDPRRSAISILSEVMDEKQIGKIFPSKDTPLLLKMLKDNINSPLSSSAGRVFDAASALLGACTNSTYDAEAPMKLEALAHFYTGDKADKPYSYDITKTEGKLIIDLAPAFMDMFKELPDRTPEYIASAFHITMAHAVNETCNKISSTTGIETVALSGGVFQNTYLLCEVITLLKKSGFNVLIHNKLSPNDSSISLGQAVRAAMAVKQ